MAPRISIVGLPAFTALVGVTLAALRAETELMAGAMLNLALASSGVAIIAVLFTRGADRAGWAGFLIFGTGYLTLCIAPWFDEHLMPSFATTQLADRRYSRMHYTPESLGESVWSSPDFERWMQDYRAGSAGRIYEIIAESSDHFKFIDEKNLVTIYGSSQLRAVSPTGYRRLCHSLVSLWAGLFGMMLGRHFFARQNDVPTTRGLPI